MEKNPRGSRSMKIRRLGIANRGEVAVRIIQACKDLGITSVLLHSEADKKTLAYRMADETICIGPSARSESYLNIDANIRGAKEKKVDAIHPGFGFLSENANFAERVVKEKMIFVGPRAETIRQLGDKISAKDLMKKAGVPTIPGYQGEKNDIASLKKEILAIGFPVLVKAAAGGGGRGMKVVRGVDEIEEMVASAKREATEAFGDDRVFLEKYLEKPKHIEFQIFGDSHGNVIHLFERECSVQRRHQKIIEEAPSASLSLALREKMADAAVKAAKSAGYVGAGTVEFLLENDAFYFLEVNTRLQVEHPVTELITGVDLVKMQIRTAEGEPLKMQQQQLTARGHSIECRLYAEDAYQGGIPSTGTVLFQHFPLGPGRRFDFGLEAGDEVTPFYDSMIAKLIVYGESRIEAIQNMLKVLDETIIFGIKTNIPYLKKILQHEEFQLSRMTTKFIETYFNDGIEAPELSSAQEKLLKQLSATSQEVYGATSSTPTATPFSFGWRNV